VAASCSLPRGRSRPPVTSATSAERRAPPPPFFFCGLCFCGLWFVAVAGQLLTPPSHNPPRHFIAAHPRIPPSASRPALAQHPGSAARVAGRWRGVAADCSLLLLLLRHRHACNPAPRSPPRARARGRLVQARSGQAPPCSWLRQPNSMPPILFASRDVTTIFLQLQARVNRQALRTRLTRRHLKRHY
jgi:hypothetical protein